MSHPALTGSLNINCLMSSGCQQFEQWFIWVGKKTHKASIRCSLTALLSESQTQIINCPFFGGRTFIVHFHIILMLDIFHGFVGIVGLNFDCSILQTLLVYAVLCFSLQCFIFWILYLNKSVSLCTLWRRHSINGNGMLSKNKIKYWPSTASSLFGLFLFWTNTKNNIYIYNFNTNDYIYDQCFSIIQLCYTCSLFPFYMQNRQGELPSFGPMCNVPGIYWR